MFQVSWILNIALLPDIAILIPRIELTVASCTYAEVVGRKPSGVPSRRADEDDFRKRINRLESSILSLISEKSKPTQPLSPESSNDAELHCPDQAGGQRISRDTRSTHWDTILSEVSSIYPRPRKGYSAKTWILLAWCHERCLQWRKRIRRSSK